MKRTAITTVLALTISWSVAFTLAPAVQAHSDPSARGILSRTGFNPLVASSAQLIQHGYPTRPTDVASLARWTIAMQHARYYDQPHPQVSSVFHRPLVGSLASDGHTRVSGNWAGYEVQNSVVFGDAITYVDGAWTQPSVPGDSHYTNYLYAPAASFWVGIGETGNILQSGCDSIATATPTYKCWTEDLPLGTMYEGPATSPGSAMYVSVNYLGNSQTTYFIENETSGHYMSLTHPSPYVASNPATFINERVGSYYLPNFGSVSFAGCAGSSAAHGFALQTSNGNVITMENAGGTVLSQPSSVNNSTDGFTVTWKHS
jgi:Peptidase A4 family